MTKETYCIVDLFNKDVFLFSKLSLSIVVFMFHCTVQVVQNVCDNDIKMSPSSLWNFVIMQIPLSIRK